MDGAVVQVSDLVKDYPGGTRAVDGLSFRVAPGERLGFLGPKVPARPSPSASLPPC